MLTRRDLLVGLAAAPVVETALTATLPAERPCKPGCPRGEGWGSYCACDLDRFGSLHTVGIDHGLGPDRPAIVVLHESESPVWFDGQLAILSSRGPE